MAAERTPAGPGPARGDASRRSFTRLLLRRSLTRRRSRVFIAVLAVAIGATTLFALATLAIDAPRHLNRDLRELGANLIVLPDGPPLTPATLAAVDQALAGHDVVSETATRFATVRINSQPYTAAATDLAQVQAAKPYWDVEGDWPRAAGEVLIGRDIAQWTGLAAGDDITLTAAGADPEARDNALAVTVTGLLATGGEEDAFVVLSPAALAELTGEDPGADVLELSVAADEKALQDLADTLIATVDGVTAGPVTRLTRSEADVLTLLRTLFALTAGIVLALTLIGVATTMMAVVAERKSEIALSKALGADDKTIARQFLAEGLAVGLTGGLVGTALGHGLAQAISQSVFHRPAGFFGWLALATVVAATGVTYLACQLPVRRATQVDPAQYLREE